MISLQQVFVCFTITNQMIKNPITKSIMTTIYDRYRINCKIIQITEEYLQT